MENNYDKIELMAEIARLYYEEDCTQTEIGRLLNVSHSTVSRLLKEARETKLVEIIIRYPSSTNTLLEEKLKEKFKLKQARVLADSNLPYDELIQNVGRLAARLFESYLRDGMTVSVAWGNSIFATVQAVRATHPIRLRIVRTQGAISNEAMDGTDAVRHLANQLNADYLTVFSPLILKSREICKVMLEEPSIKEVLGIAERADLALVGIGSVKPEFSSMLRNGFVSQEDLDQLIKVGVVGDICGKQLDITGNVPDIEFNQRVVSIDIKRLREIPMVIGVSAGIQKAEAILAALRGRYINALVTDSAVARYLLNADLNNFTVK